MFDTFGLLLSDSFQALGRPDQRFLDPEDLTRAAFQALAFFGLDAQFSEYGRESKTVPLNANAREFLLSTAPDIMLPSYVERRIGDEPNEYWQWVPIVRNSLLEELRMQGVAAASFFKEANGFRVVLSYEPNDVEHRLRYYTDPTTVGDHDDPLPLPGRFGFMLSHKTVINAVPMMLARSSHLPTEPVNQQLNTPQIEALTAVVGHAQSELREWDHLWKKEKTADRNARGRNRRSMVPRGL